MAYCIIVPSPSGNKGIYDRLAPGSIVSLRAEPSNPADPNAVAVFFEETLIGYLGNRLNDTVPAGAWPASKVAKNLGLDNVAGVQAKLVVSSVYIVKERDKKTGEIRYDESGRPIPMTDKVGNPITQVHWKAELFWIPVWDTGAGDSNTLTLTVGGANVMNGDKATVIKNFDTLTPDDIIMKLGTYNGEAIASLFRKALLGENNPSPCGQVMRPPEELMSVLELGKELPVTPLKVKSSSQYEVSVKLSAANLEDFYGEMEDVVRRCVMQVNEIKKRVLYLLDQKVPAHIIRGVLRYIDSPTCALPIECPTQLYKQSMQDNVLTRALGYYLSGRNVRLVGEKGAGKNTLVMTVCWLFNQPLCRFQGSADMDSCQLLGGQTLDEKGTRFELSSFVKTLQEGGDVVLDEINTIKPEIAVLIHSLTDDAKSIHVPGYGLVSVHPRSRFWGTMNENYVGTGEMNPATADRFVPLFLGNQMDLQEMLKERFPSAKADDIQSCKTLYDKILKATREGKCSSDAITTRGYIDAMESTQWLPLKQTLIDNIARRPQDSDEQKAIEAFILAMFP